MGTHGGGITTSCMAANKLSFVLLVCCLLVVFFPTRLRAGIAEYDEVWKQREEDAKKAANEVFKNDPMNVTDHFNGQVREAIRWANSSTRRSLRKINRYTGPCMATNPIDRCWRCNPRWADDRKQLAKCARGFGQGTTGGLNGRYYLVTDSSDSDVQNPKPGTLRHALNQKEPLWIIFARNMVIRLSRELLFTNDKTIDGRGVDVHIAFGDGFNIQFVKNIIIHGLHIHDIVGTPGGMIRDSVDHIGLRTQSDGDGIGLFGSTNIWIDHVSMSHCQDGLIDVIQGSTAVTISNCHFTNHNEVMLFGSSDAYEGDTIMQITVAFNHFGKGLVQRMPRCRWGFVHVVNNDYTHWIMYAIGGSSRPTIISQGNRFIAPPNLAAKEVTKRDYATPEQWKNWMWRSDRDLMMNGAFFVESGDHNPIVRKRGMMRALSGDHVSHLTMFSGALECKVGRPC